MPAQSVLQWRDGRGWLVLAGGESAATRAKVLARAITDGGLAVIWAASNIDAGDHLLDDLEDLGAPSGFLVDVLSEPDDSLRTHLAEAGIVVIGDGDDVSQLRSGVLGAAIEGIQTAYNNGAVILVEGQSIALMGAWITPRTGLLTDGLNWVANGLLLPTTHVTVERIKELLLQYPSSIAITISPESALALGPDGEVEVWGDREITITLGAEHRRT